MPLQFLLLREAAVLIGCALAAYTDIRTGLIPHKLTAPLIALGFILNLFEPQMLYFFALGGAVFALTYLLYHAGQLGGGDVMLFTGIALLIPWFGEFPAMPFIFTALFFAALASVLFLGIYYFVRYWRKGIDFKENARGIKRAGFLGVAMAAYFYFIFSVNLLSWQAFTFLLPALFFGLVFIALEEGIRKHFFLQEVRLSELEEDEIVAWNFLPQGIQQELNLKFKRLIGEQEKKKLEQLGLKKVFVYRNLPRFAPFMLAGVVLALYFPDFFLTLLSVPAY